MSLPFSEAKEPTSLEIETGRKLFSAGVMFLKGVVAIDGLPSGDRPEFCFAGRSNVGKSSLINALTQQKHLARTSNTPGRTQEINYFTLSEEAYMVDLPGYGFAEAPVHIVEQWQRLLKAYLTGRASLRRAFLLIDHRHGPKPADREIMTLLDKAAVTFQVILTKSDKLKPSARETALNMLRAELNKHPAAYPEIISTSSQKGEGIANLRAEIAKLIAN